MVEKMNPDIKQLLSELINSSSWYKNDENGFFNWDLSIQFLAKKMSNIISISAERLKIIIESSFEDNSLTETIDERIFLDELLKIDPSLIIWTEGDINWQAKKITQSKINEKTKKIFQNPNKINILENLINLIKQETENKKIILVVIDDKEKNLEAIEKLNPKFKNIEIITYKLDLHSSEKNPDSCLAFLKELATNNTIRIISDMDRVLIDTEKTFNEIVVPRIIKNITLLSQ